jgi:hypothetical protein
MYAPKFKKLTRKQECMSLRNYIPHKNPINLNYNLWKQTYYIYLNDLFNILKNIINERYNNNIVWSDNNIFEKFCIFIFKHSSKYITKK